MRRLLLLALLTMACDPYDPSLGDRPFLCGTDEPRCPEGYVPVDVSKQPPRCECQRAAVAPDASSEYGCNADGFEPNDGPGAPTEIAEVALDPEATFRGLAICPSADQDFFAATISREGTVLVAQVSFDMTRSAPRLDIVGAGGQSLNPRRDTPRPGVITATVTTTAARTYMAKIEADEEVNYDLIMTVTPP